MATRKFPATGSGQPPDRDVPRSRGLKELAGVGLRYRRRRRRTSAHRGVAGGRRAELLLDLVHGESALRTSELRLAYLHLLIDHEGFGNSGARERRATQQCGQNAGLHAMTLPERLRLTITPREICQSGPGKQHTEL